MDRKTGSLFLILMAMWLFLGAGEFLQIQYAIIRNRSPGSKGSHGRSKSMSMQDRVSYYLFQVTVLAKYVQTAVAYIPHL